MNGTQDPLSVLHIIIRAGSTNGQYNEHCLPVVERRRISACCFHPIAEQPPKTMKVFEGNSTPLSFWRAMRTSIIEGQPDLIHVHAVQTAVLFLLGRCAGWARGTPSVFTIQNCYQNYSRRNRLLFFPVVPFFDHVIVCSQACLESLPRLLRWLVGNKISVIQNSVDTDRVAAVLETEEAVSRKYRHFDVVSIGRLIAIKDPIVLLKAFARAANEGDQLKFVGEGNLQPVIGETASRIGVENRVQFTGLCARDDVYRHVNDASLFVSTSLGEGLPVAVLEAMACGCPVILSDIEPHREIVGSETFIPIVPTGDIEGFAREIKRFQCMSPQERALIGKRCRLLVESKFSLGVMHDRHEDLYRQLTGEHPGHLAWA